MSEQISCPVLKKSSLPPIQGAEKSENDLYVYQPQVLYNERGRFRICFLEEHVKRDSILVIN